MSLYLPLSHNTDFLSKQNMPFVVVWTITDGCHWKRKLVHQAGLLVQLL